MDYLRSLHHLWDRGSLLKTDRYGKREGGERCCNKVEEDDEGEEGARIGW